MICCQGFAQNNLGHGKVGGGIDELRISHELVTAGSWVMGKWGSLHQTPSINVIVKYHKLINFNIFDVFQLI